jgi:hypothetical protein
MGILWFSEFTLVNAVCGGYIQFNHRSLYMKKSFLIIPLSLVLGMGFLAAQNQQNSEIKIHKITAELRAPPVYQMQQGPRAPMPEANKKWLAIEVELTSKAEWAEEVQVKFYVVANYGSSAKGDYVPRDKYDVLATTVNIVNMQGNEAGGKKNVVPVFMDPKTVKRYGESAIGSFIPEVAVQVYYKGILQDTKWMRNQQKSGRFWEAKQPKSGVLLNFLQSPFFPAFFEEYEQVKPSGSSNS